MNVKYEADFIANAGLDCLVLDDVTLQDISHKLDLEMTRGLGKTSHHQASVKCFVTYVQHTPDGSERGQYLALDLGGTNFRVLLVTLGDNKQVKVQGQKFKVPRDLMTSTGEQLFDYLAACVSEVTHAYSVHDLHLPLGFTFSFPCDQHSLSKATLFSWTKGFDCSGVQGRDVGTLLEQAIARRNDIKVKLVALINDTTGTLMSCAYTQDKCRVGVNIGTGTNACYLEEVSKVEKWEGLPEGHVVINTEWGAFGDNGELDSIRTEFDLQIDSQSINPRKQTFEKMISGMYLGELVRAILLKLAQQGKVFTGQTYEVLHTPGCITTKHISDIESSDVAQISELLQSLDLPSTAIDVSKVKTVCRLVTERAAKLTAAGITCLLRRTGLNDVTVAVDGAVYRFHPHFSHIVREKIKLLLSSSVKFELVLSEDGSGLGAALVAAVAVKNHNK